MVRVIPLFIHSMLRGEPITIYGGNDKTLDFTYVDDCIDGIVSGIEALAEGRVVNQTINLAYGQGNTLVRCAELIAGELGTSPDMTLAPSLLGEVTHYVADLSKARGLLGYGPKVSLDEGIARAVAWFREHRAAASGGGRAGPRRPRGHRRERASASGSRRGCSAYGAAPRLSPSSRAAPGRGSRRGSSRGPRAA